MPTIDLNSNFKFELRDDSVVLLNQDNDVLKSYNLSEFSSLTSKMIDLEIDLENAQQDEHVVDEV